SGWQYSSGYSVVGGVMLALSVMFLITRPRWEQASALRSPPGLGIGPIETLRHPAVLLQIAVFFLYTGLEIALSQWAFTVLTESRGVLTGPEGIVVGIYLASSGGGRMLFGLVADRVGIDRLLRYCLLAAAAGAVLFALPLSVEAAFAGLILAGLGLAPVFP